MKPPKNPISPSIPDHHQSAILVHCSHAKLVDVTELVANPRNPNKHSDKQVALLAKIIRHQGWRSPITVSNRSGFVVTGHGRLQAAILLGEQLVPVDRQDFASEADEWAHLVADNRIAELADADKSMIADLLKDLDAGGLDMDLTGFDMDALDELMEQTNPPDITEDEVPDVPVDPITQPGDLWILGEHRVLCGDSTKAEDVGRLMAGQKAQLIHADPPYGMGKESEGVENDNLNGDNLDKFQMAWWRTFRPHAEENASAYIWGNAEGLWRLWYVGGLKDSERLTIRNEIIWNKPMGQGLKDGMCRCYGNNSERCLFFMLGEQGFNNNADNYWEGWEPIRKYLNDEMEKCGGTKNWKAALGNQMGTHYFTKSQWNFPTEEAYKKLQAFGKVDAFKREHDELKREHDELKREFYGTRAYFDNTHDNMTDVWEFNRVTGEERHGHATPKPIEMMARAIKSSTEDGGLLVEPFLGSGSTLIASEQLGRKCYGMEISPAYCDVIVKRWENLTGNKAVLSND
jgi:DNA modification methylase